MAEPSNVIDLAAQDYVREQRNASSSVTQSFEDDPEKAAKSIQIGEQSGQDPSVVYGNFDTADREYRTTLTDSLIKNNRFLRDFINDNPIAAKVSHDDIGSLDAVSEKLSKLGVSQAPMFAPIIGGLKAVQGGIFQKGIEGFKEGYGERPLGAWISQEEQERIMQMKPFGPASLVAWQIVGLPIEVPGRVISGGLHALRNVVAASGEAYGMSQGEANRLARDVAGWAEYQLMQTPGKGTGVPKVTEALGNAKIAQQFNQALEAAKVAEPYVLAGKEPPLGLHSLIDEMKKRQSELDLKNLDEAQKEAQGSATRERAPALFENYVKQHNDITIGIPADAVAELYGNKMPHAEDKLLGWAPDIEKQMYTALATGGDIEIPLSSWLARVDPETAKVLHDHIRVRRGGLTKFEADSISDSLSAKPTPLEVDGPTHVVRQGAKLDPLFERPKGWEQAGPAPDRLEGREGQWEPVSRNVEAFFPKEFEPYAEAMIPLIEEELNRIVPKGVDFQGAATIRKTADKKEVGGVYSQFSQHLPLITLALERQVDVVGIARHEAIHHLRAYGFFTDAEWATLERAAKEERWVAAAYEGPGTSVGRRYKDLPPEKILEEAIADQFKYWDRNPGEKTIAAPIFEKLRAFLEKIWERLQALVTKNPEVIDIFKQIRSGEIGSREPTGPRDPQAFRPEQYAEGTQPELPGLTRQEDMRIFSTIAGWMNKEQYARYQELIAKRNAEDADFSFKKAERIERKRQTQEWKAEETKVKAEVSGEFDSRPDISAMEYLRNGKLYGEDTGTRPRINPQSLTPEQRALLPEKYQRRDGMDPSDAASLFGYPTFDEFAAKVRQMDDAIGKASLRDHVAKMEAQEVERRMQERFGNLNENILQEAMEHVISPVQMDLLHEETVALGMKVGSEMTFTKADFRKWAEERFKEAQASSVSMEKYLKEAGKAGREVELALLKDDAPEAFRQKQRQYIAVLLAGEAKKFERGQAQTERLIRRYASKANLPGVAQEYTDQVHQLLQSVGSKLRRTPENIELSSQGKSLTDFIAEKNATGDGIIDPELPSGKTLDKFTVEEYRDFANTLKSLDHNGREAKTIEVGWEKLERADAIEGVVESLEPLKKFDLKQAPPKGLIGRFLREVDARLIKVEQLADWIDHNDPRGWFNQTVVRPLYRAQHLRGDTIAQLAKDIKAIPVDRAWGRGLNDPAGNLLLRDAEGNLLTLTNENKIAIALNMGNESNKSVLLRGHSWRESDVVQFLQDTMKDMDWAFVEGIWKVFDKVAPFVEEATTKRSGVPIEMVQPSPILGRDGGYYPLIKDPVEALVGKQIETDLVDKPFFAPLPMARALKQRTGVAYPLDLSINAIASRINETLHAALFQDPIRNARKVTSDESVRRGIAEAFGPEYVKQIDAWLKDIANNGGEHADAQAAWLSRNLRENVVFGLMGYKLSTAAIHGLSAGVASGYEVGPLHLAKNIKRLGIAQAIPDVARRFFANEKQMWEQVDWAQETFPELRNRMQDIGRDMQAQVATIVRKGFVDDAARIRAVNLVWSMKMVATLDQLTATPVAIAAYRKAIAEGWSEKDAAYAGEKAVRLAHGSPSLVGRANIGRGEAGKWLTIAYNGYWNHNYNRTRSAVRDIKNPEVGYTDKLVIGSAALTAFIIAPAIIHYAIRGSDNNTFTGAASEALLSQLGGQVPIVNTLMHSVMHDRDPHVSPFDELLTHAWSTIKDVKHLEQGKKAEKFLKHAVETPGYLFGIGASNQLGTALQFNFDVMRDKQRPKSILEWARGEITGEIKAKVRKRR